MQRDKNMQIRSTTKVTIVVRRTKCDLLQATSYHAIPLTAQISDAVYHLFVVYFFSGKCGISSTLQMSRTRTWPLRSDAGVWWSTSADIVLTYSHNVITCRLCHHPQLCHSYSAQTCHALLASCLCTASSFVVAFLCDSGAGYKWHDLLAYLTTL